jgi:small-conductance mechanosensitive channel
MPKSTRILILTLLILASLILWILNFTYPDQYIAKGTYSFTASAIIYLLFGVLFEDLVIKRIKDSKTRYSLRRAISIVSLIVFLITITSIWIAETQNLLITVGLIGAAIAFAVQDVFKNFIGGLTIFLSGLYRVGDRIEINQKYGDVIDISLFYTTLMETREWIQGDQTTGRLTLIPNGAVLTGVVQNYTRDFTFIWDELTIPLTYDSDWNQAATKILGIVQKETAQFRANSEKTMERLQGRYYFTQRSLEPAIFVSLTDNWITFGIRYVTEVSNRRATHDHLSRMILAEIEKSPDIKIASSTIDIIGFPKVEIQKENSKNNPQTPQ